MQSSFEMCLHLTNVLAINLLSLVTPTLASRPLIISAKENVLEQAMMMDGVLGGVLGQVSGLYLQNSISGKNLKFKII